MLSAVVWPLSDKRSCMNGFNERRVMASLWARHLTRTGEAVYSIPGIVPRDSLMANVFYHELAVRGPSLEQSIILDRYLHPQLEAQGRYPC